MKNDGRYMVDNFGIDMNKIKIIILGPLSFLIILLVPLSVMDIQARGGLGILIWMALWWTSGNISVLTSSPPVR